jgi:hypothetical protein
MALCTRAEVKSAQVEKLLKLGADVFLTVRTVTKPQKWIPSVQSHEKKRFSQTESTSIFKYICMSATAPLSLIRKGDCQEQGETHCPRSKAFRA